MDVREEAYKQTGVDTAEADDGLSPIVRRVTATWPREGSGRVVLPIGYFANVIELDGKGIAICTDGVGTKTMIATMMGKFDTIGIDCVAMNVNDMICVGARPRPWSTTSRSLAPMRRCSMTSRRGYAKAPAGGNLDLRWRDRATQGYRDAVSTLSAWRSAASNSTRSSAARTWAGDIVIGVNSNGIHSNGLSLARRTFFERHHYASIIVSTNSPAASARSCSVRPTSMSAKQWTSSTGCGREGPDQHHQRRSVEPGARGCPVGFVIDRLIEPHPIFALIQRHAGVDDGEMYEVFNMGIGFCYVVDPSAIDATLSILRAWSRGATHRPCGFRS